MPQDPHAILPQGYFDAPTPQGKERSTVGSASATGSVGGRTTWASGSDNYDHDKMSEEMDTSSTDGFSEGNASLVGFGEGASSTVSGPVSTAPGSRTPQRQSGLGSPYQPKATPVPQYMRDVQSFQMTGVPGASSTQSGVSTAEQKRSARTTDGIAYDSGVIDTNSTHQSVYGSGRGFSQMDTADGNGREPSDRGEDDTSGMRMQVDSD